MSKQYVVPGSLPIQVIEGVQQIIAPRNVVSGVTSGTALTLLQTLTIPALALEFDGKTIVIFAQGVILGAAGTKRLQVLEGANVFIDVAGVATSNAGYLIMIVITRLTATRYMGSIFIVPNLGYAGGTFGSIYQGQTDITNFNPSNPLTITFSGQCTNGADTITQTCAIPMMI